MELTCALVLLIVASVTASPYGYGTKGGAAAKADARAVAGAYSGAGSIPLSIPSGSSYSGSFSQSSSSSSSSSSASSSSFSYSGSGAVGGVVPAAHGCGSGSCNAGGASGTQGSAATGSQAYSGANAGSLAGGYEGKLPTSSYGHKYNNGGSHDNKGQDCGTEGCQGANSNALNGNSAAYDAKTAASAGAESSAGSDCDGLDCNNAPNSDKDCISGQCGSKVKCSSGNCGPDSPVIGASDTSNKCTSSVCRMTHDTEGSSSINNDSNDINVHGSGSPGSTSSYGTTGSSCINGNCNSPPARETPASGYSKPAKDLTAPKLEPPCSGSNCHLSKSSSNSQNDNQLAFVSSPGNEGHIKTTYTHGFPPSYSSIKLPGGATCAPGDPGCGMTAPHNGPSDCSSGSCDTNTSPPGNSGSTSSEPSHFHGSTPSVNPSSHTCTPGTPGCISTTSTGSSSDCASGNCVPSSFEVKPTYTAGGSATYPSVNSAGPVCAPGTPGCNTTPFVSRPSDCASGNCGVSPSAYGSSLGTKPNYSHGSSSSYSSLRPSNSGCAPGTPGCVTPTSSVISGCASGNCDGFPSSAVYGALPSNKPAYSQSGSLPYSPINPPGAECTPGTPGCGTFPSASGPIGCPSGQCGSNPSVSGYGTSLNDRPNYSHEISPSNNPAKPLAQPCSAGAPGCSAAPTASGPSGCISGNCGVYPSAPGYSHSLNTKPNYSHGGFPYSSTIPSGSTCSPGSPGCGLPLVVSSPSGCTSGNCGALPASTGSSFGIKPSNSYGSLSAYDHLKPSVTACAPGTPGCALPLAPSGAVDCTSGNCDEFPPLGGQGFPTNKPTYFPVKPSGPACAPGLPGCATTSPLNPSGCDSGKCGTYPSLQSCTPGTPGCFGLSSGAHTGASSHPKTEASVPVTGTSSFPSGQASVGISAPGYGSLGTGSSLHQAAFGAHGTGSYNKPSVGFTSGTSGTGAYTSGFPSAPTISGNAPVIGSSPHSSIVGATGTSSQQDVKDQPAYTGGFGGPAGLLKPNEYSASPTSSFSNKPTVPIAPMATVKPSCGSGVCEASPSLSHSGSASGAHAVAGASASDAVAYTGGFGGPPGFLKPYDNGIVQDQTGKLETGSSLDLNQGVTGSGIHSTYLNGGSQIAGGAVANAAAISSAGASSGDKLHSGSYGGYSHGHDAAGGCGGGCGGSGSGGLGYGGSFALSKAGVLNESNNGLATAGAAAKSVATASSGARAFGSGSSYASSSATAHAGSSVKGYGRR